LEGGPIQKFWAWVGLLLITGLYAVAAHLFRQTRFVWLAALLSIAPWTILSNLGWYTPWRPTVPGYGLSWVILAWGLFALGLRLYHLPNFGPRYARPVSMVSQGLLIFALLWGIADVNTSLFSLALAVALYALAAWLDHQATCRSLATGETQRSLWRQTRFFYPTLGLIPVWSLYFLTWLLPLARHEHYGLLLLAFGPLGLLAAEWLRRRSPNAVSATGPASIAGYTLPGYLTGYLALIVGTMLVAHQPPLLALALLFDALLMLVSAWHLLLPLWIYLASLLTPISLLIALSERDIPANRQGWWLLALAAIYLALAWLLQRVKLPAYATSVLAIGFVLLALSLPPSSQDQIGALVGYGGATLLYLLTAIWLRQPLLLIPTCALVVVPYNVLLQRSAWPPVYYGLGLYLGGLLALGLAWQLDLRLGAWRDFPWGRPLRWGQAAAERLFGWWSLAPYTLGFGLAMAAPFFTAGSGRASALNFLLLMPVCGWAVYRFRLRGWLLALAAAGHLAAISWLSADPWHYRQAALWLRMVPVTVLTLLAAYLIERRWQEAPPVTPGRLWAGWSRPLYALTAIAMLLAQRASLGASEAAAGVTLSHALIIGGLASLWRLKRWPYFSTILGMIAFNQWALAQSGEITRWPVVLALLALAYGVVGFGLAWYGDSQQAEGASWDRAAIWPLPLQQTGLGLSVLVLLMTLVMGLDLVGWTIRAIFGFPFREIVELPTVLMVVQVLGVLGLLYLTATLYRRWLRLGYAAVGMLLLAWLIYIFYVTEWATLGRVQWYAVPAGLYLLALAYLEWQRDNKPLARTIDYAAMVLMLGSLFWQTLVLGWAYFLLLIIEGLLAMWWGSARRLRRFLYAGMVGVVLATLGQLINALSSINQWLVFGIIGLLLVAGAIMVERKLEDLKSWQESLESWE
jgi:hypothetical protein